MGVLYVAGERPRSGATSVVLALASVWRRAGRKVALAKPVSFVDDDQDAVAFADTTGSGWDAALIAPRGVVDDVLAEAGSRVEAMSGDADVVIVEGLPYADAAGEPTPGSAVLAERFGAKVLIVLPHHHSQEAADITRLQDAYAGPMAGVIVNGRIAYTGERGDNAGALFGGTNPRLLGVLPELRIMLAPTVRQVVDRLEGTVYAGASGMDRLVERFLIGGLITEWGGNYFGRFDDQAVIVRGGRTDIQMSALNTPLRALILTGCDRPPQYVHQRATDLDVPLVTVRLNTHETAAALESLQEAVPAVHPDKIAEFAALLEGALDWPALNAAVGLA